MRNPDMTALLNSTSLTKIEGIVLTPVERATGRLMRAPDHDGGSGDAGGSGDGSGDSGGSDTGGADGAGDGSDAGGDDAGGDGADDASGDDATALGSANAGDGAGDDAGGASKDGKDGEGDKGQDDTVPEAYELKPFKVGEGDQATEVQIDTALLEKITPGLKDAGVTQGQLEKLAPSVVPAIQEQVFKQQADDFAATRAEWAKEAQADPEIGGKNWKASLANAAKALDHFGAPSEIKEVDGKKQETNPFRVLLNQSGLGEHPVMIRMFSKIGAAIAEDGTFARSEGPVVKKSREEIMYPEDAPKKE